jgi:Protein of unknown function (DUF4446)
MHDLTTTQGIAALAAGGVAVMALLLALVLAFRLRRLQSAQRAVLGESGQQDLVAHAARLERAFIDLREWVEDTGARLEARMAMAEERLEGCVAYLSLIRYDAYGEMSGRQSSSVALLDSRRSGVVLSSILHRDQARVYVKQVHEGESDFELSPEEQKAIQTALSGGAGAPAEA